MFDVNKEREAFEAWAKTASNGWASFTKYSDGSYATDKLNFAWAAWLEKAKAQAVPEGYCLVPKEPTEVMERAGFDKGAGFLANSIYKAMVEVSESGAEG